MICHSYNHRTIMASLQLNTLLDALLRGREKLKTIIIGTGLRIYHLVLKTIVAALSLA